MNANDGDGIFEIRVTAMSAGAHVTDRMNVEECIGDGDNAGLHSLGLPRNATRAWLGAVLALAVTTTGACSWSRDLADAFFGPDQEPDSSAMVDGLLVQAWGRVTPDEPRNIVIGVRVTNTTGRTATLHANRDCKLTLQIYDDDKRSGNPVWPRSFGTVCTLAAQELVLRSGDVTEISTSVSVVEVLRAGVAAGFYYFALDTDIGLDLPLLAAGEGWLQAES